MIISIESEGSSVRIEQEHIDNEMLLDEVFYSLIEPALLGFGFQKGSILDVCEEYLMENCAEYMTKSRSKDDEECVTTDNEVLIEDDEEEDEECEKKCSKYRLGYDAGYLAGLREAMLNIRRLTE
jgi:hypothetical protein|tara:strand:+ start:513 stop:887 length:375 start_codon:yes stop_codon:yes gene_type:complete